MSTNPYLSEIDLFSFNFAPNHWAQCNGQLLPINQNQALFSLLGTTYGGNGQTTFALPDLRGRAALGFGQGSGLSDYFLGQSAGSESIALVAAGLPPHTHAVNPAAITGTARCRSGAGTQQTPVGGVPAVDASNAVMPYNSDAAPAGTLNSGALALSGTLSASSTGTGQAHENRQPHLPITFCIALTGVFPPRS